MAGGRVAPSVVTDWLINLRVRPQWAGLVVSDPFDTSDPLSVEIIGDAYRRPLCVLELVDTVLRNATALTWAGLMPMTRTTGVAGFDAPFNGKPLWYCHGDDPVDFPAGGSYSLARGEIYIGVDS